MISLDSTLNPNAEHRMLVFGNVQMSLQPAPGSYGTVLPDANTLVMPPVWQGSELATILVKVKFNSNFIPH